LNEKQEFAKEVLIKHHSCGAIDGIRKSSNPNKSKIVNESFIVQYSSSGIGTCAKLVCCFCLKEYDITDVSEW
jgi:hypothetical protein